MVDAINLPFLDDFADPRVQSFGRFQIMAERFFHNYAAPMIVLLGKEPTLPQLLNDDPEIFGGGGKIEKEIRVGVVFFVDFLQRILQAGVRVGIFEIALNVVHTPGEPFPQLRIDRAGSELVYVLRHAVAELLVRHGGTSYADDRELAREQLFAGQIVERRNKFAAGKIAGRAEDDHNVRVARTADARAGG